MNLISVGQLIDQTWEHYRAYWRELISLSAWMLVPTIVAMVATMLYPSASTMLMTANFSTLESTAIVIWFLNNTLLTPILGLLIFIMTVKLISAQREKTKTDFKPLIKNSTKLFFPIVLVNLLIGLIMAAAWLLVLPGAIMYLIESFTKLSWLGNIGIVFLAAGIIAATVLSVDWIVSFAYAPLALITENQRGRKALKYAKKLIDGRFWSTLIRMVAPKIIFILILLAIEWAVGYLIGIGVSAASGLNTDLAAKLTDMSTTLSVAIGTILINPLIIASDVLLFESLKESKKEN